MKDKKKWGKITSINAAFTHILGKSVLSVQGEEWKAQRKVLNPGFTAGHVKTLTPSFNEVADNLLEKLDKICGKTDCFEPYVWMSKVTLDALGKAGFGEDFGVLSDKLSIVYSSYETIFQALMNPLFLKKWYTKLPTKTNAAFIDAQKHFFAWAQSIIDQKLKAIEAGNTSESKSILDLLVNSHYHEGSITREELTQNFLLFFLAGHETTSGTLTMLIYFLSRHPEVQERCRKEIEEIFGDEDPTVETISQLKYVENVILEASRIYGPANGLARGALEDCEVQGYFMPKGTIINILMCNLHNDPDLWQNPSEFNPDRWNSDALRNSSNTYMPFGGGSRICLGLSFAKVEMRVTLVKLIRRYEFFPKTSNLSFPRSISLRPQPGFLVGIKLRK